MDFDLFTKVVDQIKSSCMWLTLYSWGEPFLNRRIHEYIEYAHNKNIATIISSNLNKPLTPKIAEQVIKSGLDSKDLAKRGESLIRQSSNRYLTTVRIAFRAKQRRFDDFDGLLEESSVKPVQRAIIELSDEQDQPDLLPG